MKPNTESSSAPSLLLQVIILHPPVPALMMGHRLEPEETAAAGAQGSCGDGQALGPGSTFEACPGAGMRAGPHTQLDASGRETG